MKQPNLTALESVKPQDPFFEKVQEIKEQGINTKPKTYSLPVKHINYIDQKASKISQERGKAVSASEALRLIIDEHEKGSRS